jgi:carbon-monoxide dehydrogenase large subunit
VVEIVRYTTIDDVGTVINPSIVDGQVHGGIAQGVGQALFEDCRYDTDTGQLVSGSFLDYCLPRADDLPSFRVETFDLPSTGNPLGVKGGGEGGTTPALGAVINAVCDALGGLGVRHIDMPATPQRVWRAMAAAKRR